MSISTSVTLNGSSYTIPAQGEGNWGTNVSNYLIALSTGVLQKAGGTFTLTADVDFGATYGLKSAYYKSRNTPSTAGIVRLGNNESVGWRNAANSADLLLKVNASNVLEFNSSIIGLLAAALTASRALVSDGSGNISVSSVTSTQLAYLASATGTTGTTSTKLVFSTSPTLVTPVLGVASATSINKVALTAPATGSTLTIADGKTLTASNTMTLAGADDTAALTLAAGNQVVGGNSNNNDIITRAATQTISAKTLTAPQINGGTASNTTQWIVPKDTTTNLASLTKTEAALVYSSDEDKLFVGDGTDWKAVGSGAGASGRNYLSDWFDGTKSVGTPTSGITATGNVTISTTNWQGNDTTKLTVANVTSGGIRGDAMTNSGAKALKLDHLAVGAGFIQTPNFQLDLVDLGKPVMVSFDHGAVTTADDYQVMMVRYNSSGTYQEQINIAGTASATSPYSARMEAGSTTTFRGFFVAGSTSTDYYALRFYRNNASDTTDIQIDSLYVGPQSVVQGAAVTDPVSFTPTWTNLSNISSQAWEWWRQGKYMGIKGYVKLSGAVAGEIAFTIPGGYSIDTTSILTSGQNSELGNVTYTDSGTTNAYGTVTYGSSTTLKFIGNSSSVWNATSPITWAANDVISCTALVPISNWSSNVTMANRAVEEYASNSSSGTTDDTSTSNFSYGIGGSTLNFSTTPAGISFKRRVRFTSSIQPTDKLIVEVSQDRIKWQEPSAGGVGTGGYGFDPLRYDGTNLIGIGITTTESTATDCYVVFGKYRSGTSTAWDANTSPYYYRVRKVASGASVGYPISTANVVGRTDGLTVGSGYIGEKITGTILAPSLTTTVNANAGSISLTAGVWLLVGKCYFNAAASTTSTQNILGFSATSATIDTDKQVITGTTAAGVDPCLQLTEYINVGSTTTYYMVANSTFATSTMAVHATASTLYAIRIA